MPGTEGHKQGGQQGHGGQGGAGQGATPNRDHLLDLDPDAVPALRGAFVRALDQIDRQIELADGELPVQVWAGDPVSKEAAVAVNTLVGADLDALRSFQAQLSTAVHNLDLIATQYRVLEDDTTATVSQTGGA